MGETLPSKTTSSRTMATTTTPQPSSSLPYLITFLAGASYGLTTVLIGQPLDTIKTRMQGLKNSPTTVTTQTRSATSAVQVFRELYGSEGLRGLYRGGLPLVIGGSVMRSAQFGVR